MGALVHVTAWERVSLWRRIPIAFVRVAILAALLITLINILGPPIAIFVTARWVGMKLPAVKVTPMPLSDYSVSSGPGTAFSYFGYNFEVPWNQGFKQKAFRADGLVRLQFESGQDMLLISPSDQSGLLTQITQDKSSDLKSLQFVFGDLMNRSPYDQYSALLDTTPRSIRAFGPRAEAVRGTTLLTLKAIAMGPGLNTGAFSFQWPDKRGFQVGDPRKSRRVDLEIFDLGGHHVEIIFGTAKEGIYLTQPDINRILKSIHAVPTNSPTAQTANVSAVSK